MAFPDTVVLAVHQETLRLYRHGRHIILTTLGFVEEDALSAQDLKQLLLRSRVNASYDVQAAYDRNIKGIYSAIIEFISQATLSKGMPQSGRLYWLREANRHIVEAIKDSKHLQKNLILMDTSQNHFVKQEYDKIRLQITELIRQLDKLRIQVKQSGSNEINLLSFDIFKVKIKDQDQQMNERIDGLIREHKVTPDAGTSLINDSAYMYAIKKHLVAMAETIFIVQQDKITDAQREMVLDENELINTMQSNNPGLQRKK